MPGDQSGVGPSVGDSIYSHAVLVDTGAFIALEDPRDGHHREATDCLNELGRRRVPLIVSLPTIFESHSHILYDLGERKARFFIHHIYDGSLNIRQTSKEDELAALLILDRFTDLRLTLVDAANMALMGRLGIGTCFGFDHHFLQAGFAMIPPFYA